jgi:predicted ATPase
LRGPGERFTSRTERNQDFAEAVRICEALATAYTECGYELLDLPLDTVEKRIRFVPDAAGWVHHA